MTLLSISLLVFSIIILFSTILFVIWWKKYGKSLFSTLKNMQNPQNFIKNMGNLGNLEDFYKNMGNFGGQMGGFNNKIINLNQKMSEFLKKMTKK